MLVVILVCYEYRHSIICTTFSESVGIVQNPAVIFACMCTNEALMMSGKHLYSTMLLSIFPSSSYTTLLCIALLGHPDHIIIVCR